MMMAESEEQFATSGLITDQEGEALQALLEAAGGSFGGALPSGQYQIGPYTVTPSDDQSGMLEYVVRMQDALQEAVTALHQKETKINELSMKVSQLTEEKSHATSKLNVLTRSVQEKDQRMRVAKKELADLKSSYKELEEEKPRKASTEAKRKLAETRKEMSAMKLEQREMKQKLGELLKERADLDVKCGALQEETQTTLGRYNSLEEQRVAAQEQVSALTWKLQAFEQQYAALYQQYTNQIQSSSSAPVMNNEQADIPRALSADVAPPAELLSNLPPPASQTSSFSSSISLEEAPRAHDEKQPLVSSHQCTQCGTAGSDKQRIGVQGTVHRRRNGSLPIWLPERVAAVLSLRSAPRIKAMFSIYLLMLHLYLVFFCLLGS